MTNEEAIKLMIEKIKPCVGGQCGEAVAMAIEALKAQDGSLDEWCTDCKEYDTEKHCCPRFNRVIRTALQDAMQDTVSRQTAIDALGNSTEFIKRVLAEDIVRSEREKYSWGLGLIEACIADLKELPSAEPEIIRCKDCEYWRAGTVSKICTKGIITSIMNCGDDFCSYAERRTDETD